MKQTPNERLLKVIRTVPRVSLQNRLLRMTDREIAVSMMFMEENDRNSIFDILSSRKRNRVKEELLLHQRLRINYNQYLTVIEHVVQQLTREHIKPGSRSYLRPIR